SYVNSIALGTSERLNMFVCIKSACTQKEKLQILNKAVTDESSLNEEINFRAYRVNLLCDIGDWKKALLDLKFIENIDMMMDSLYFTKWKCMMQCNMAGTRQEIVNRLYDKSINSDRHIALLGRISEEKINQLVNENEALCTQSQKRRSK
ncbi:unnamed protein product, partial [Rotaria sordida]